MYRIWLGAESRETSPNEVDPKPNSATTHPTFTAESTMEAGMDDDGLDVRADQAQRTLHGGGVNLELPEGAGQGIRP